MKHVFGAVCVLSTGLTAPFAAWAGDGHPNIYSFTGGLDGTTPRSDLLVDAHGNMYGTAPFGGAFNNGTVYQVVPTANGTGPATLTTLYSFTGAADGSVPVAGLVADAQGNLYGTTSMDGSGLSGTVFKLLPPASGQTAWTEQTIWSFGAAAGGKTPVGDLRFGPAGVLFGTTNWGGANGQGTVFELSPPASGQTAWAETIVWNFTGGLDGGQPAASVLVDASGALYGTAKVGGSSGVGTVFKLIPPAAGQTAWGQSTLWSFTGGMDGSEPTSSLVGDARGAVYGTTTFGGANAVTCAQARFPFYGDPQTQNAPALGAPYIPAGGDRCGTVFQVAPPASGGTTWTLSTIYAFQGSPDGGTPVSGLAMLSDNSLVGFTVNLGHAFYGATYRLIPPPQPGGTWTQTEPASFNADSEGLYASAPPAAGVAGQVYGAMTAGGTSWVHGKSAGYGMVFSVNPLASVHFASTPRRQ